MNEISDGWMTTSSIYIPAVQIFNKQNIIWQDENFSDDTQK